MDRRRILMILGVAWVSATILTWYVVSRSRAPQRDKTVRIYAAARDLPVGSRLRQSDLKAVSVPEKDLPRGAFSRETDLVDRTLLYPVAANEPLTPLRLASQAGAEGVPATIEPGMRAMSVQITDVSGVAGLIQPGSRVDVLFTKTGNIAEAVTTTVLQNIRVLAIGRVYQIGQQVDPRAPRMPVATLIVTPDQAQRLELAKNQGRISLALRNPLDQATAEGIKPVTAEAIEPEILDRAARARQRVTPAAGLRPPNAEAPPRGKQASAASGLPAAALAEGRPGEQEPKPKRVVDVFRGDRHSQEVFP